MTKDEEFQLKYKELRILCDEIRKYYDIDKIKSWSVYIWSKGTPENEYGENLFDIEANKLVFYNHTDSEIIDEARPIIEKIQLKLKEIGLISKESN